MKSNPGDQMNFKKITVSFLLLILINFSANALELKIPKVGGKKADKKVDISEAKLNFTKIFFESSSEYILAQAYLFDALGMNDEASKARKSREFSSNKKNKEGKRLTNAFNTVSDNSAALEKALTKEVVLSAEAKVAYAKSLPHAIKGLLGTIKLPPEAKALLDTLKADKMAALKMGDFIKILPKIPEYVSNATKISKLVVTGAKSRGVEGADDATKALDEL